MSTTMRTDRLKPLFLAFVLTLICLPAQAQWLSNGSTIQYTNDKVGIGTSNPTSSLDVHGGAAIVNGSTSLGPVRLNIGVNGDLNGGHGSPFAFFGAFPINSPTTKIPIYMGASVMVNTTTMDFDHSLVVDGSILAREVMVTDLGWADHVFEDDYPLLPLGELAAAIEQRGHLPGIPSAAEVAEDGVGLADMQVRLLEKIEELSLYVIDLHERNLDLERRLAEVEEQP